MRSVSIIAAAVVAAFLPALAADGRIPIYGPATISQAGSYYLTRDISVNTPGAPVVTIAATAGRVTLDLAGHSVTQQDALTPVIEGVAAGSALHVGIAGGTIVAGGGTYGIHLAAPGGSFRIERVTVVNPGPDGGIAVEGTSLDRAVAAVEGNVLVFGGNSKGIVAKNLAGGSIVSNDVRGTPNDFYGIWVEDSTGVRIGSNTVSTVGSGAGIYLLNIANSTVDHNTVRGCDIGLYLDSSTRNAVDWNLVASNGNEGILFTGTSTGNVYGYNRTPGNGLGGIACACGGGCNACNTNGGGNF